MTLLGEKALLQKKMNTISLQLRAKKIIIRSLSNSPEKIRSETVVAR